MSSNSLPLSRTYLTTYTYDLLNHLTQVSMPRPTGTQTRTFVYNGNELMSATNPENGTVTYTYNSMHKVATRTDAKNQTVQYSYDSIGRLTQDGKATYYYDINPFDSTYSGYALGRLAAVQYGDGGMGCSIAGSSSPDCGTTFTEMYSYDQAGATAGKRLRVARTLSWTDYYGHAQSQAENVDLDGVFSYDNKGRLTDVYYPMSGPHVTYAYDTMGRLNTLTDVTANNPLISGTTYGPSNELLSIAGATYFQYSENRAYNTMLQLTNLQESACGYPMNCSPASLNLTYAYSPTQNNGKITSQTDSISGEQVVYTYDVLNGLASAQATNGSWGQSYTYDGLGNLTDQNVIAGSAPSYHVVPNPTTNHLGGEDANGNAKAGSVGCQIGTTIYCYDVENRMVGQDSTIYGGAAVLRTAMTLATGACGRGYIPAARGPRMKSRTTARRARSSQFMG